MQWDGEHHFFQEVRIPLAVGQAMPQLMFDTSQPKSEGVALFQLDGSVEVLFNRLDILSIECLIGGRPRRAL